ncbi:hypothetical protein Ppb6_02680 [Photorhabdus australis subsp. thailandensis]|uniref:Uncharacterized protein n=1 Tax=Photorhabdus australis subsp. thailandensis TaxID=2805096 RepID=A0A1C0U2N9_9GAMM|nr:hypothetical protein [Photorhabdus australis]OCQ52173.1 hypothetical protein Ppb6_02680 [Photorhabdus australis subsp. thailandensis]
MRLEHDLAENTLARVVNMQLPLDEIFNEMNGLLSEHGVEDGLYALNQPDIDDKYCLHFRGRSLGSVLFRKRWKTWAMHFL